MTNEWNTMPKSGEEARMDELQAGIGETRDGLTDTVQAIGDRLEPANLAREAGDTVRSATIGKVDQMTTGAHQTWSDIRTGNPTGIVDTIRANPIPAGMVVAGVALLFMKRGSQASISSMGKGGEMRYGDYGAYGGYDRSGAYRVGSHESGAFGYGQGGQSPVEKLGEVASDAGDKVGKAVEDLSGNVSRAASDFGDQSSHMARKRASQLQDAYESNPIGFGIAAVTAGAALGLLLPSTPVERQAMGPTRDKLVDQAEGMVHETLDKVEEQTPVTSGTATGALV